VPITEDEARAVTLTFVREYPGALAIAYRFREDLTELYERRAAELPQGLKGGYSPQDTLHRGRSYRGRVDVPLQNMDGPDDLFMTLRHEVLGHYGANTFRPENKRALLDGLIAAREEPSLKPLWAVIDRHYSNSPVEMRAEEVFALQCESIEPHRHQTIDGDVQRQRGQQAFRETCIDRVRLMQHADLDNIALMVAQGLRDRTRTQQTFPKIQEIQANARTLRPPEQRVFLNIPFNEKDAAKEAARAAGFKLVFDKTVSTWYGPKGVWYAPKGADLEKAGLVRFLPERVQAERVSKESPQEAFLKAIQAAGLELRKNEPLPVMDGQFHGAKRHGTYVGYLDGRVPGGFIENFKTGERVNWKYEDDDRSQVNTPEKLARHDMAIVERSAQQAAATAAKYEAAAKVAQAIFQEAQPASASDPYCAMKGITRPGDLGLKAVPGAVSEEAQALGIRIAQTPYEAHKMREAQPDAHVFLARDLLIPARDADGKLWSVQTINPNFKGFMKDGRKGGLYTIAGVEPSKFAATLEQNPSMPLVFAEGYATGNTSARLLGHPVIAAFDAGNLDAVIRETRSRWPERELLIAADNDHESPFKMMPNGKPGINTGLLKAIAAVKEHGGSVVFPQFNRGDKGSDWDDHARQHGDAVARKALMDQIARRPGYAEAHKEFERQVKEAEATRADMALPKTTQARETRTPATKETGDKDPQAREREAVQFAVQSIQRQAAAKGHPLSTEGLEQASRAVQERFAREPGAIGKTLHSRQQYTAQAQASKAAWQHHQTAPQHHAVSLER